MGITRDISKLIDTSSVLTPPNRLVVDNDSQVPLEIVNDNASGRLKFTSSNSSATYNYLQFSTTNGNGYLIKNIANGGNGLANGRLYLWNDSSTDNGIDIVPNATINNRVSIDADGTTTFRNKVFGTGMVLLGSSEWTGTNVTGAIFDVFDDTKYTNYMLYWYVNHGPSWSVTGARFRNSSGDISLSDYYNNTKWMGADQTSPTWNSASYAGNQNYMWMAGNGTPYNSQGHCIITIPTDGSDRASIRGISQLIYRTASTSHYIETFSSTLQVNQPHVNLTGIHIYGTGGASSHGRFKIFGIEN